MATKNGTGADARLNSPQERPREGDAGQERAWLAGLAWLSGLTSAERDAALATAATPAQAPAAAPSHAETLTDIAGEIRRWGSVGLFGAADRLEALAQELAVDAPAVQPAEWTPAAKRVSLARDALFQAVQVADLLIGELDRDRHDETPLYLGLTVRVRELADAADLLLTDACEEEDAIPQATRMIFGPCYRPRAAEGVVL